MPGPTTNVATTNNPISHLAVVTTNYRIWPQSTNKWGHNQQPHITSGCGYNQQQHMVIAKTNYDKDTTNNHTMPEPTTKYFFRSYGYIKISRTPISQPEKLFGHHRCTKPIVFCMKAIASDLCKLFLDKGTFKRALLAAFAQKITSSVFSASKSPGDPHRKCIAF